MTHEGATLRLDPAGEAIAPPAGPVRVGARPPALVAWLLVAIAGLGLLVSSPPSAGPDEPAHAVTAWYLSGHGLRPGSTEWFSVPESIAVAACYSQFSDLTAGCMPPGSNAVTVSSTADVLNYPPLYYWVVGSGQRLAAAVAGNEFADVGGRLASSILNLGALLVLSLYMRRRSPLWGTFLLMVSTPMAVFMAIVVNPNGWEITCGLAIAAVLSEAVWGRQSLGADRWPVSTTLILAGISVALALARPLGFVWAAGLTGSAIVLAPSVNRRLVLRVACAVAPGIVAGLLWTLAYPTLNPGSPFNVVVTAPPVVLYLASLCYFPLRAFQMSGDLGWLDTPEPLLLFVAIIAAWGVLLRRLPNISRAAILCGVFGILILPSAIETVGWASWPHWWQGRYTLPFALGFALLLLLRSGHLVPRTVSIVSGLSLLSLGVMVWVNAARYDFGLGGFGLPFSLTPDGLSPVRLWLSVAIGGLLCLSSSYLLFQAWRMGRPVPAGPVAQTTSISPSP